MEFIPPPGEGKGIRDEATNALDVEAEPSEDEGHKDSGEPDVQSPSFPFVLSSFFLIPFFY